MIVVKIIGDRQHHNYYNYYQTQETVWYTGKQGVKIAGFDRNKNVELKGSNGIIDLSTMSLQTGSDVEVYDGVTKFIEAPYIDELITADGLTVKITHDAYSATPGKEIDYIYKLSGSGIAGSTKYTQLAVADAEHFSYDPVTKTITLPEDVFEKNEVVIAQYKYKATGTRISSDTEHFSKTAKVVADLTTQDVCDNSLTHSQIIIHRGKIDGNFGLAIGDSPAIHSISVSCMPSLCLGAAKELFTYQLVNPIE